MSPGSLPRPTPEQQGAGGKQDALTNLGRACCRRLASVTRKGLDGNCRGRKEISPNKSIKPGKTQPTSEPQLGRWAAEGLAPGDSGKKSGLRRCARSRQKSAAPGCRDRLRPAQEQDCQCLCGAWGLPCCSRGCWTQPGSGLSGQQRGRCG